MTTSHFIGYSVAILSLMIQLLGKGLMRKCGLKQYQHLPLFNNRTSRSTEQINQQLVWHFLVCPLNTYKKHTVEISGQGLDLPSKFTSCVLLPNLFANFNFRHRFTSRIIINIHFLCIFVYFSADCSAYWLASKSVQHEGTFLNFVVFYQWFVISPKSRPIIF